MKKHLLSVLLTACVAAHAAPFATTHTGTITASTLPGAVDGEPFRFTVIFDNGGTTAAGQTWSRGDLTCVIVRVGNAGAEFRQDLRAHVPDTLNTFATMPDGSIDRIFSGVRNTAVQAGEYTANGLALEDPVGWGYWVTGGSNPPFTVLQDRNGQRGFASNLIHVYAAWSPPVAVTGACDDTPPPPPPGNVQSVPALGLPALVLLGLGAAGLGAHRLRRKS